MDHAVPCLFLGVVKGFLTNLVTSQKTLKAYGVIFNSYSIMATPIWTLAVAPVPPVHTTSQLDEGILCVFALGKLGNGEVFSSFDERRPA